MKRKFKLGQEVIFVKSKIPFSEDQGVMDKYIGTVGIIESLNSSDDMYDYLVRFGTDQYSVRKDEIIKITKATRVLYGL